MHTFKIVRLRNPKLPRYDVLPSRSSHVLVQNTFRPETFVPVALQEMAVPDENELRNVLLEERI